MGYKYLDIYDTIKKAILDGKIQYGQKILTEFQLMEKFQCSQLTAKNAVKKLVEEGYIERKARAGSFCIYKRKHYENGKVKVILHTPTHDNIQVLKGITDELSRYNMGFDIAYIYFDKANQEREMAGIESSGYLGLIVDPALEASGEETFVRLIRKKFPFVVYDTFSKQMTYNTVSCNSFKGEFDMTDYLIKLGHTKIAYYSNYTKLSSTMRQRYDGYLEAMRCNGLSVNRRNVYLLEKGQYNLISANALQIFAAKILENENKFTAIVCGNDSLALSLIACARQRGVQIPTKFSIVGFDDSDGAADSIPALTTVAQPFYEMGRQCASILFNNIIKRDINTVQVFAEGKIVERNSVRAISAPPRP